MKNKKDPESSLCECLKRSGDALIEGHNQLMVAAEILAKKEPTDLVNDSVKTSCTTRILSTRLLMLSNR